MGKKSSKIGHFVKFTNLMRMIVSDQFEDVKYDLVKTSV